MNWLDRSWPDHPRLGGAACGPRSPRCAALVARLPPPPARAAFPGNVLLAPSSARPETPNLSRAASAASTDGLFAASAERERRWGPRANPQVFDGLATCAFWAFARGSILRALACLRGCAGPFGVSDLRIHNPRIFPPDAIGKVPNLPTTCTSSDLSARDVFPAIAITHIAQVPNPPATCRSAKGAPARETAEDEASNRARAVRPSSARRRRSPWWSRISNAEFEIVRLSRAPPGRTPRRVGGARWRA